MEKQFIKEIFLKPDLYSISTDLAIFTDNGEKIIYLYDTRWGNPDEFTRYKECSIPCISEHRGYSGTYFSEQGGFEEPILKRCVEEVYSRYIAPFPPEKTTWVMHATAQTGFPRLLDLMYLPYGTKYQHEAPALVPAEDPVHEEIEVMNKSRLACSMIRGF